MHHNAVDFFETTPDAVPLQRIDDEVLAAHDVTLMLKREDLLHPQISGNKWRKLKYNLIRAQELGHTKLLTFGGAYSNHILAVAAAGSLFGFETIGIIRGEEYAPLNPVLQRAQTHGMDLHYMSRAAYRGKMSDAVLEELRGRHGTFYLLPEGGTNGLAVQGCSEIVRDLALTGADFDLIIAPCGTGGTLAGLVAGLHMHYPTCAKRALGVSVLKSRPTEKRGKTDFLSQTVSDLLTDSVLVKWAINHEYAHGGYANTTPPLLNFMEEFEQRHAITLDPIYAGKMLFALYDLIQKRQVDSGTTIVAILTGQGSPLYG